MESFGFIITRHVTSEKTNKYWNHSVKLLNTFYPNKKIIIIDDNSNIDFVKELCNHSNIEIINAEFKGRGELLPYYYYLKNKYFDNAIIIHDSVFFHKKINFEILVKSCVKVLPLWFFYPDNENVNNTTRICGKLNNSNLILPYVSSHNKILGFTNWYGCFGAQTFINHAFLNFLENKYSFTNLLSEIKCRTDRCSFERIIGVMFYAEYDKLKYRKSIFGNIFDYQIWGYPYENYMKDLKNGTLPRYTIKVWTGR